MSLRERIVGMLGGQIAKAAVPAIVPAGGTWLGFPSTSSFPPGQGDRCGPGSWQRNLDRVPDSTLLSFSAVYACINAISSDIAKLPWLVWKQRPSNKGRTPQPKHPIQAVLDTPNPYQTRMDFMSQLLVSTLYTGNAYIFLRRDRAGAVVAMHPLPPSMVRPLMSTDGDVFYSVSTMPFNVEAINGYADGDTAIIPARDVIHHRLFTLSHPLLGVTPLFAAASSAYAGMNITDSQRTFFANMSRASGVLQAPAKISNELAARLKKDWEEAFSGGNLGRTAVLGEGLEWKPISMNAIDSQLIEQLRWTIDDVARVYRVPMFLIGDASRSTYRNSEQMTRQYYANCLQYHIESLEIRFNQALGLGANIYTEFDLAALLRTDLDVRFAAYRDALQAGWLMINEVRALEDLPPVEGGDEPLVQQQYQPLSMAGSVRMPAGPPPPDADPEPDPPDTDDPPDDDPPPKKGKARARARASA
jgi:HK97 family phage portal protein